MNFQFGQIFGEQLELVIGAVEQDKVHIFSEGLKM